MEQPARKHEFSFDPRVDDPAWRAEQRESLKEYVRELEAEHGPVDPKLRAAIRAKMDAWPE